MPTVLTPSAPASNPTRTRRGLNAVEVLGELEKLRDSLQAGDQFPSQKELMRRLDASERAIAGALDELSRQGKIVKRLGRGGSYVTDVRGSSREVLEKQTEVYSRTIVTISEPDGSIFDRALQLLARHPDAPQMAINCRLMQRQNWESFVLPSAAEKPLGYLLFGGFFAPLAQKLQASGQRVVLIGAPPDAGAGVPNVYCDHEEGGYLITRDLLEMGHRKIMFQSDGGNPNGPRWHGAARALREKGLCAPPVFMFEKLAELVKKPGPFLDLFYGAASPTALVAWNDHQAIQLLTMLQSGGIRVPADVSLVGYDNLPQGATLSPALSTADSAIERQLSAAVRLLEQPEAASPNHTVVVLPTLVRRDSSAPISN